MSVCLKVQKWTLTDTKVTFHDVDIHIQSVHEGIKFPCNLLCDSKANFPETLRKHKINNN